MKIIFFALLIFIGNLSLFSIEVNSSKNISAEKESESSVDAAQRWLQLIDRKQYAESWDVGSLTLHLTLPKQFWVSLMEKLRKPYGSFISRTLVMERPSKNPENLPKGDYSIVVFRSSFSQERSLNEMVTLVQESDGHWRVLTYLTQKAS